MAMEAHVAQAVLSAYKGMGPIDGRRGRMLVEVYLRALGIEVDRYGNYVSKDRKTRWHFKQQVVRKERKSENGGDWFSVSSTPLIEAGHSVVKGAAEALNDSAVLAKIAKATSSRKKTAETRASKAKMEENLEAAKIDALKALAAKYPLRFYRAGEEDFRSPDAKNMADELAVLTDQALERVERGERIDDGKIVSASKPPVACFFNEKIHYFWTEKVDGVEYSILIAPQSRRRDDGALCEVHIGRPSASGWVPFLSSSTLKLSHREQNRDALGDGYLSGDIVRKPEPGSDLVARVTLISSHQKRQGAGTRLLSLWCQLMSGYGIDKWIARGVGSEGRAALEAWARGKRIDILAEEGASMLVACKHHGRSIFSQLPEPDPNQMRLPGMARGARAQRR